jgi:hypothetical protein
MSSESNWIEVDGLRYGEHMIRALEIELRHLRSQALTDEEREALGWLSGFVIASRRFTAGQSPVAIDLMDRAITLLDKLLKDSP